MLPTPAVLPVGPAAVVDATGHPALRADIRRLAALLGDTLVRQEGPGRSMRYTIQGYATDRPESQRY